jgi:hypothetical protein
MTVRGVRGQDHVGKHDAKHAFAVHALDERIDFHLSGIRLTEQLIQPLHLGHSLKKPPESDPTQTYVQLLLYLRGGRSNKAEVYSQTLQLIGLRTHVDVDDLAEDLVRSIMCNLQNMRQTNHRSVFLTCSMSIPPTGEPSMTGPCDRRSIKIAK